MDEYAKHGLVMPFVTVVSRGGPHDDASYCAGYEMGILDAVLSFGCNDEPRNIRTESLEQADLLAFRHGYQMSADSDFGGWTRVTFTKN